MFQNKLTYWIYFFFYYLEYEMHGKMHSFFFSLNLNLNLKHNILMKWNLTVVVSQKNILKFENFFAFAII